MMHSRAGAGRRLAAAAMLLAGTMLGIVGLRPAHASVTSVSGRAFGYYSNVGFFGGPQEVRGFGQTIPPGNTASASPSVTLPSTGGNLTQTDTDGATGIYGPATIFESHGTMTVDTSGTTGAGGSVTSSAAVNDISPQDPFTAAAPGGVSSTCTATETGLTGSTTITNGRIVVADPDPDTSGETGEIVVTPPVNPGSGTEYAGIVPTVDDYFTIVLNEQLLTPDEITVNAVHMYIEGPTAVGDMIIGQSRCGVVGTTANQAPVANDDAYSAAEGQALTVPVAGLLGNDTDPDSDPLTAAIIPPVAPPTSGTLCAPYPARCAVWGSASDPANGALTLNVDGSFTYRPNPGFSGVDTFTYKAQDPRGSSDAATVTVTVAPAPTTVAINDVSVTEGNTGTTTANFTITRAGDTSGASSVKYKTANTTATSPSDYTAIANTVLNFAAGETSKPVSVTVNGDTVGEANETFKVTLSTPVGTTIADTTGIATILNDDPQSYLSIDDAVVTEGNAGTTTANFIITRSGNTAVASTVSYKTTAGTATAGTDFTAIALTPVTFAATETTKPVSVTVAGDAVDEVNETFTVDLSVPVGAVIADASGAGTIVDDDGPVTAGPSTFFSVGDVSVTEGNVGTTTATFTIVRSGDTTGTGSVKYKTANTTATAPSDYVAKPLTVLSFAAGETSKPVVVTVNGDTVFEGNETFKLTLSAPVGGVLSDNTAVATIVDDEPATYLSVNDIWITEGDTGTTTATFTIVRSGDTTGLSTVSYKTTTGTAGAADFTGLPLTPVTFLGGQTYKLVSVSITGDTINEVDETFTLDLSAPVSATISDSAGTATIVDNE